LPLLSYAGVVAPLTAVISFCLWADRACVVLLVLTDHKRSKFYFQWLGPRFAAQAPFLRWQFNECKLHAPYPASSRQIGCIQSKASRKPWLSPRRVSACGNAPPKKEIPKISKNFPKSLSEQIATPVNNEEM
jgi:hypothetical protein